MIVEDIPCLYLPCLVTKDMPGTSTQYKLLIRLLQNASIGRIASYSSLSPTPVSSSMMQGKQAYHSVNNKMGGLSEYSPTEEIGFDIDGEQVQSESEDDPIDPWMIDVVGVRHTRTYRPASGANGTGVSKNTVEFLESVHKKVVCSDTTIFENREEIICAIDKLLPRLRYESLVATVSLFKQYNMIAQEQPDINHLSCQVLIRWVGYL